MENSIPMGEFRRRAYRLVKVTPDWIRNDRVLCRTRWELDLRIGGRFDQDGIRGLEVDWGEVLEVYTEKGAVRNGSGGNSRRNSGGPLCYT